MQFIRSHFNEHFRSHLMPDEQLKMLKIFVTYQSPINNYLLCYVREVMLVIYTHLL